MKNDQKKQRETKEKTNLSHSNYKKPKLLFLSMIGWLDSVNILANHRPRSWKSLEKLDCFKVQSNL